MEKWPHSRPVQVLISVSFSTIAAVITFPAAEKYLVGYYGRASGAVHDGQTGLSVIAGAGAASLAVFAGILLSSLVVQQFKAGRFSKKR